MHLLIIPWDVDPEIFRIGPFAIRWYGLLFASSFVVGYIIMNKIFKNENLKDEVLDRLTIYMAVGVIAGARLGHCLFYEPAYYLANPLEILMIWHGGLASHGAAVGILIAIWYFAKKEKKDYTWTLDRIAIVVALSGFFIRMGNLMNSEIYGVETTVPGGVVFLRNGEGSASLSIQPCRQATSSGQPTFRP
jgi:prolipoprotein diacylglyceryl transferase